jgi:outer membrane lipoprotein-sorting protein
MLSKTRFARLIFPSIFLIFIFLFGYKSAFTQLETTKTTDKLTAPQILANVRKAVSYDKIKKLKRGFAIEEIRESADSSNTTIRMFGRTGEVRQEAKPQDTNTFVFDGKELWMINRSAASSRNGSPYPVNQKQLEKLVLPWWIQSNWWLDEKAPLDIAVLPIESNEMRVTLSVKIKNGVVGSKLFVDRATWLPTALFVEQAKGFLTLELKDYQKTLGFLFPHRFESQLRQFR